LDEEDEEEEEKKRPFDDKEREFRAIKRT